MMKKYIIILVAMMMAIGADAQRYSFTFEIKGVKDDVLYVGRHYRDKLQLLDTAKVIDGKCTFKGHKKWDRGVYALVKQTKKSSYIDFLVDGSQQFSFVINEKNQVENVKGSESNKLMYDYINELNNARATAEELNKRIKQGDKKAKEEMEALDKKMMTTENETIEKNQKYLFFELIRQFNGPDVPEEEPNKPYYYQMHYWDDVNLKDHSLIYTPELFDKMNYYFFGMLYNAEFDTICKYADRVLERVEDDPVMLEYFLEYIMPNYYRSTTKIGWDATWCYLVRKYYLTGKCTWASAGTLNNKRQTAEFLEQSLIGAQGAELWMADTNQSENPEDWISSHRLPYKYVILWFWDPDCNHCKAQTEELIKLYNDQTAAGTRNFEVYAVGFESDVPKWKKYVKEHHLPFVNVGGPNVNIDYQEAYNVHGAPTMIILNEKRQIIMNKNLPAKSIIPFLKQYEKKQNQK